MARPGPIARGIERTRQFYERKRDQYRDRFETVVLPALRSRRPRGNVVVFHVGRCGSTVLGDMLGRHPEIYWGGEAYTKHIQAWEYAHGREIVLDDDEFRLDPLALTRSQMARTIRPYYGLEVKPFHLRLGGLRLDEFVAGLDGLGFTHFVVLRRENLLRGIVSSAVAQKTGKYQQRPRAAPRLDRIELDVERLAIARQVAGVLSFLDSYRAFYYALPAALEERPSLELTYEHDIAGGPETAYRRVCDFLDVAPRPAKVRFGRTNPFSLRDYVANYDELAAALSGTDYEWMLTA